METVNKTIDISYIIPILRAIIVGMVGLIALDVLINVAEWICTSVVTRYPSNYEYTIFILIVIVLNILAYITIGMLAVRVNKGMLNNFTGAVVLGVIAAAIVNLVPGNMADALHWLFWAYTGNFLLLGNPYLYHVLMLLGLIFAVPLSELGVYLYAKRHGATAETA